MLGQYTYSFDYGSCTSHCAADLRSGTYTDLEPVLNSMGLSGSGGALSTRDGYAFFSACDANSNCGIYEAQIDRAGSFVAGTFQKLAQTATAHSHMATARHPVTGTTVLFSHESSTTIDVWEQPAGGGPLTLIAQVPSVQSSHYTALTDATKVVLHYYGGAILKNGSYTLAVTANGGKLAAGSSNFISGQDRGTELASLPAASKWALFYRVSGNVLTRCWVTP